MEPLRKLPIGIQSFEDLITSGYLYVDKTEFIWKLVTFGKPYFLSRPRRFGKSLLLSTMEAYFSGKKELFTGLKIAEYEVSQKEPWQEYPVLRFDFSPGQYDSVKDLENRLDFMLSEYEKIYGTSEAKDFASRFYAVIASAYSKTGKKVVVLVDEYDKPLLSTQYINAELNEKYRNILKGFYGVLKASDGHLRFVFLTGVSQFSRLSIFSDMNQFINISTDDGFAEICGITEEELKNTFTPEIKKLAEKNNLKFDEAMLELKTHYDGYRFSKNGKHLYNPFSLLSCLSAEEIENYWYQTGTPTFLINLLKQGNFDIRTLDNTESVSLDCLRNSEPKLENPIPILFQAGYLTLKEYNPRFRSFSLKFPNEEVKYAFLENLLPEYLSKKAVGEFFVGRFVEDIESGNVEEFMRRLTAVIAGLPYSCADKTNSEMRERDYHIALYLVFTLMGQYTQTEVHSLKGRADCIVETEESVYVFEIKLLEKGSAEEALEQIKERGYGEKYRAKNKSIKLIGVAFDEKKENLGEWKMENI
ncbi:ATP-binding protein [Treponema pedis]|uniref:ATP-binding protein n=3 Tax=Treponema pedis TaxID=409322 RepID=A0A7S6WNK8_9SPIR|nr:ATP-binding protein [Treponema pedis]QOW60435.1 ATP-binding protein [Treponema pedis]